MSNRNKTTKLVVTGVALLMALALGPTLAGLSSAAPVSPAATGSVSAEWAYGGQNGSSGTYSAPNATLSWSATVGIVVIFNATNTSAHTVELSAERTVSIVLSVTGTVTNNSTTYTAAYALDLLEVDSAHANISNDSSVMVGGNATPALGIDNASASVRDNLSESLVVSDAAVNPLLADYLNVSGAAQASVQFSPSLGLIPLNLTGISSWSSSATATPSASWSINYTWVQHLLGTTTNGSGKGGGGWNATGVVTLSGSAFTVGLPHFSDGKTRTAVVLEITGPVDLYDGFILIPSGFDFLGGGTHVWAGHSFGSATMHPEDLYVLGGRIGVRSLSAARAQFGATGSVALAVPETGAPQTSTSPSGQVTMQPESPSQAQAQADCLQHGCPAAGSWFSGLVAIGLIALVVGVIAAAGVFEWRSHSRRKTSSNLAGTSGRSGLSGASNGAAGSPSAGTPAQSPPSPGGPGSGP